jgi:hypothetical protein
MTEDESLSDSTTVDTPPSEQDEKPIKLITRIGSIPIIYDITNKTYLGKLALSTASTTLSTVNKYQPKYIQTYYESYLQPHVEKVDDYGCRSFDLIQKVVSQPTSAIGFIDKRIEPVVDSFEAVIDKYLPTTKREAGGNQAVRVYHLLNDARSRIIPRSREAAVEVVEKIQALQVQLVTLVQQSYVVQKAQSIQQSTQQTMLVLIQQVSAQLEKLLQASPFVSGVVQVAQKQVIIIRQQYEREDIQTLEKVKQVALAIQEQLKPVVEKATSHLHSS